MSTDTTQPLERLIGSYPVQAVINVAFAEAQATVTPLVYMQRQGTLIATQIILCDN